MAVAGRASAGLDALLPDQTELVTEWGSAMLRQSALPVRMVRARAIEYLRRKVDDIVDGSAS
jgi:hypothetical protein